MRKSNGGAGEGELFEADKAVELHPDPVGEDETASLVRPARAEDSATV
ncbi:hypothetical protein F4561_002085 [Lipingzhangella halophila]|uniref:Uncharacterized protein n=1 Tax=Lipingzhangella halophila TaxID=1783352 RepID=A0A7W7RG49_9ACTN|nr:hypothetical protein [Lipingzhangella halophila]MBB4931265.1 hypothetical protein [Lipingzhangella halophila]